MGDVFWCDGVSDRVCLSISHCLLRPTAEHFGQFDQTIFTTEKKNITFIVNLTRFGSVGRKPGKWGICSGVVGVLD